MSDGTKLEVAAMPLRFMKKPKEGLRGCPCGCGPDGVFLYRVGSAVIVDKENTTIKDIFVVRCNVCEALGFMSSDKGAAINMWNSGAIFFYKRWNEVNELGTGGAEEV